MSGTLALFAVAFLCAAGGSGFADVVLATAVALGASLPGRRARDGDRRPRRRLAWLARPAFVFTAASQIARGAAQTLREIAGREPGARAAFGRLSIAPIDPEEAEAFAVIVSATPGTVVLELDDATDFTLHWLDAAEADATRDDLERLRRRAAPGRRRGE